MNDRPKILLTLTIGGENGGPYTSHKRILESKLQNEYDLKPLYIPNARNLRNPRTLFSVIKQIKNEKPAIVQITGLQIEGFFMTIACKLAKVKTVLVVHGSSMEALYISKWKKRILSVLESYELKNATKIYGVSDFVSSWSRLKNRKNYFGTIYNLPIEVEPGFHKSSLRSELGLKNDDIIVVSTGRIIKDKGYDVFWKVIQSTSNNRLKFVIAGDGAYRKEWAKEIIEKGFGERVFLLGYRKDIGNILSGSDIFMICSRHETLCISVLEAAMYSLPVIATNTGGIPEIVGSDGGFLVENEDIKGFVNALEHLSSDKILIKKIGQNINIRVANKFNADKILRRLDELYQRVLLL